MPRQALAKHDLPRVIHPHRVKHVLCEIDPEDGHLLLHGTHLLWLNGFPNLLELIVAHCRRSAQGRVHFITTVRCPIDPTAQLLQQAHHYTARPAPPATGEPAAATGHFPGSPVAAGTSATGKSGVLGGLVVVGVCWPCV